MSKRATRSLQKRLKRKMRTQHEEYRHDRAWSDSITTYDDMKYAVKHGCSIQNILKRCPVGQPKHIMLDLYKRAREEIWEEREPQKTRMGRYIYV